MLNLNVNPVICEKELDKFLAKVSFFSSESRGTIIHSLSLGLIFLWYGKVVVRIKCVHASRLEITPCGPQNHTHSHL